MLTGGRTSVVSRTTARRGRVVHLAGGRGQTVVTIDAGDGRRDVVVPLEPDHRGARAAAAGLWRIQWVGFDLDAPVPVARLAGTTRHPHVRTIPLAAGFALAEQGVPAFVLGEGD